MSKDIFDRECNYFQINRIAMTNFRCFPELVLELNTDKREITLNDKSKEVAPLTVIVAKNGMGKTSVLDAIRIAYGTFTSSFSYKSSVTIQHHDIRIEKDNSGLCFPVGIDAVADIGNSWYEWIRIVNDEGQRPKIWLKKEGGLQIKHCGGNPFKRFINELHEADKKNSVLPLPILASYGTDRLWKKSSKKDKKRNLITNRMWGYSSCLDAASSYKESFEWLTDAIIARLNENQIGIQKNQVLNDQLQAIESALKIVLDSEGYLPSLHLDPFFQELAIVQGNWGKGISIPVSQMSDGVQALFFMVADIAFRCAKLNPQFKEDAAESTSGIVLIDEVDLHLHPSWQQKVLDNLQFAFPRIQFIVTTHSPQVVSSVPRECVRIINEGKIVPFNTQTQGVESQDILMQIFGTYPAPPNDPFVQMLKQYADMEAHDQADSEAGIKLRQQLIQHFGKQYPPFQRIEVHRKFFANRKGGNNA